MKIEKRYTGVTYTLRELSEEQMREIISSLQDSFYTGRSRFIGKGMKPELLLILEDAMKKPLA